MAVYFLVDWFHLVVVCCCCCPTLYSWERKKGPHFSWSVFNLLLIQENLPFFPPRYWKAYYSFRLIFQALYTYRKKSVLYINAAWKLSSFFLHILATDYDDFFRLRLHEQIKHTICAQIRPELLDTDREFEQLKEVLFAHVNAALVTSDQVEKRLGYQHYEANKYIFRFWRTTS